MKKFTVLYVIWVSGMILGFNSSAVEPVNSEPAQMMEQTYHPRIFFETNDVPSLQAKAATTHQEIWLPIKDYVDSQLETRPPDAPAADDSQSTYRNYGNMLLPFAFACVITGETDYCDLTKTYLLTYAAWEQWGENNYRDLGHAHMLLANAIAYDWLYTILTPAERRIVGESLADWAQKMYEASSGPQESSWENWWRKSYLQNHYWTNNSALGMAGLVLLGEDDRAQTWIAQASSQMSRVQYILNGIADGSWHEGIPYQSYGLTLSLPFIINLKKIQGTDLLPAEYLQNYAYWHLYNHLPNSTQFILAYGNFEWEWGNAYQPQNILRFIADEYDNGHAEWLAQQLIAANGRYANVWMTPWYVFEFLYYDPVVQAQFPIDLEKARTFPDLDGVIWRTGWEDDDLIFGLKTGAYGGRFAFETFIQEIYPWEAPCLETGCQLNIGHNHNDANSFYLYRAGYWLAPENEGVGQNETAFHNTLLIDNQDQYRPPKWWGDPDTFSGSDGLLEVTANTPSFDYVVADATRRYKQIAGLENVSRHVVFVRPNYLIMLDSLAAGTPHQYQWISHFGKGVSVEDNWVQGSAGDGQILGIGVASPQPFEATAGDDGYPYVRIQATRLVADMRFIHVLYPTDQAAWDAKPAVSLIEDTGEAAATSVQWKDGSSDVILLTYAKITETMTLGAFQYDAQAAVVARDTQGKLDKLFVYGGTFVKNQAQDTVLVTNLDRNEAFEAIYRDQTVAVGGNIATEVTLYAPQAQRLLINGRLGFFSRSGDYITFGGSDSRTLLLRSSSTIQMESASKSIPEPSTLILLGLGLFVLVGIGPWRPIKRMLSNIINRKSSCVLFLSLSYLLAAHSVLWAASEVAIWGRIQAGNGLISLTSPSNDIIAEILVQEGNVVDQGTPVAVLQNKAIYETQIKLAEVKLESVDKLGDEEIALKELAIEELKKQGTQAIALQELQVEKAKQDQDIELKRLERVKRAGDAYSPQERETSEYNLETAKLNEEAEKQELVRLKAEQTSNLDIAKRELERLVLERSMEIKLAEQELALAQKQLRSAIILAPINGTILKVLRQVGEVVENNQSVMMMADLQNMFVIGEIFESEVLKIAPGMSATITSNSLPKKLHGQVESIGRVLSSNSEAVEVKIRIEEPKVVSRLINLEVSISINLQEHSPPILDKKEQKDDNS